MEVNILQSDMTEDMKKIISGFVLQGFKKKLNMKIFQNILKMNAIKNLEKNFYVLQLINLPLLAHV